MAILKTVLFRHVLANPTYKGDLNRLSFQTNILLLYKIIEEHCQNHGADEMLLSHSSYKIYFIF